MHKSISRVAEHHSRRNPGASRRRGETRDRILTAAVNLFAHKPYQAVSMDGVARAARVGKGTLYLYFPSKEALYLGLPSACLESLFGALQSSVEPGGDVTIALRRAIETTLQFYDQHADFLSLLAAGAPPPAGDRLLERSRNRGLEFFCSLIEEGMRAGVLRKGDSRLATVVILGAIRSALLYYRSARARADLGGELSQLLLRALVADAPVGPSPGYIPVRHDDASREAPSRCPDVEALHFAVGDIAVFKFRKSGET